MATSHSALTIFGTKLYQERARRALPLLVRQAEVAMSIRYAALADELGMPNPRNLNYVLGAIGNEIDRLGADWGEKIPSIQSLVLNKATGLPGEGFYPFVTTKTLSPMRKREVINQMLTDVFDYPRWQEVLDTFQLAPAQRDFESLIQAASTSRGRGGEGPRHLALKKYVASHPEVLGLSQRFAPGKTEHPLPSGDQVDVFFESKKRWIAVEIKSSISRADDQTRGLYQCIKYGAVLEAMAKTENPSVSVETILVLESEPLYRVGLKHALGVDVRCGITPSE